MDFSTIDLNELETKLIAFRRDRHRMPEMGWTEFMTTAAVIKELEKLDIPYKFGPEIHYAPARHGVPKDDVIKAAMARAVTEGADPILIEKMDGGFTGVVATIDTGKPGPTTAIRFDIDCNEVPESESNNHFPFAEGFSSTHPGLMHACGHDAHCTIGVGIANVVTACKNQFCGKILLIFQPAEEGGRLGGESIAKSGIMQGVQYVFGGHIANSAYKYGEDAAAVINMSYSKKVDLYFDGLTAHAGMAPQEGHNALAAGAAAALGLLGISRHSDGWTRVNIGSMSAGSGRNVIPGNAVLKAEVRGKDEELCEYMFKRMLEVCEGAAKMNGCIFRYEIVGYAVNAPCDDEMIECAKTAALKTDGITKMLDAEDMHGGGDDVTFFMQEAQKQGGKATYLWLGADIKVPHHNSEFNLNEKVIMTSVKLFCNMLYEINGVK